VKNPYVIGKFCYLRIPEISDIDSKWYEWFSDPIITRFLTDRFWPNTKIEQIDFIRDLIGNRERLVLLICDSRSDSLLGICGLSNINWSHRYADWSIVLPQQTDTDPRVTMEASIMLLDSAFNRLNLLNIKSATMSLNLKSLSLQKLLGFKQVGYISSLFKIEGQLYDLIYLNLTSEDFKSRNSI
jgi:RimJ/RimL family protein N-acetyltransferase